MKKQIDVSTILKQVLGEDSSMKKVTEIIDVKEDNILKKKQYVLIIDKNSFWFDHWGYIKHYDGHFYHVTGCSISSPEEGIVLLFERDQIRFLKDIRE